MQFLHSIAESLFQLSVLLPFAWLARRSMERSRVLYMVLFAFLFLFDSALIHTLNIRLFTNQGWNWTGKTASLLWALVFLYTTTLITKQQAGFTSRIKQPRSMFAVIAILLLIRLGLRLLFLGTAGSYHRETFLYEATLPGLSEELVFRGILLALLNRVFARKWTVLQTQFGWGLVLTTLLFGAVHGLSLDPSWTPHFNSQRFVMTAALGFVLGWIKEKSGSLAPGIVFHNLWNVIAYWGQ